MSVSKEHQQAESRRFVLELLGFTAAENSLLSSTFRLSTRRPFRYAEADRGERPDIYIANADNAEGLHALRECRPNVHAPAILIGRMAATLEWPLVQKPIHWTRLFDMLDQQMRVALLERARRNAGTIAWDGSARRARDGIAGAAGLTAAHPAAAAMPESVLVVDDSPTVQAFMRARLAPFRFHLDFAASGETAIDMAQVRAYHCVFLDVVMPGMDGYEVCKRIKSSSAACATPVVMLSSKASVFDRFRGSWAGCDAYLGKPVGERELLAMVARFLPGARRTAQSLLARKG